MRRFFPGLETIMGKTFGQLDNDKRGRVMLSVLPYFKGSLYLVNNIAVGMSGHFMLELNDVMRTWAAEGAAVLYLTTDSKIDVERRKRAGQRSSRISLNWKDGRRW